MKRPFVAKCGNTSSTCDADIMWRCGMWCEEWNLEGLECVA